MEQQFCQSCGMPLTEEHFSTNADGTANTDYCSYCFKDGAFTQNVTMEEMINQCLEYLTEYNKDAEQTLSKEEAIVQMRQYFPMMKRWKA